MHQTWVCIEQTQQFSLWLTQVGKHTSSFLVGFLYGMSSILDPVYYMIHALLNSLRFIPAAFLALLALYNIIVSSQSGTQFFGYYLVLNGSRSDLRIITFI